MKKIFTIIFLSIILILFIFFFLLKGNKPVLNNTDNSKENIFDNVIQTKTLNEVSINKSQDDKKLDLQNEKHNTSNDLKKIIPKINNIVEDFKLDNFKTKNPVDDFFQISKDDINVNEIKKDQCILNLVLKKSYLPVCDFVKEECSDIECKKYDCIKTNNNWFNVSYYGDFVGSGDKELILKDEDNMIIANLECEDKSKEEYDNPLFIDLITN